MIERQLISLEIELRLPEGAEPYPRMRDIAADVEGHLRAGVGSIPYGTEVRVHPYGERYVDKSYRGYRYSLGPVERSDTTPSPRLLWLGFLVSLIATLGLAWFTYDTVVRYDEYLQPAATMLFTIVTWISVACTVGFARDAWRTR